MRTSDEDESPRDDGDLEVDDHVKLTIVGFDREGLKGNAELVLEEAGLLDDADESDTVTRRLV
jgi:hypothetical protein